MNTKIMETLFGSKARIAILQLFFSDNEKKFYLREIEKLTGKSVGAIQKELANLTLINILRKTHSGNRTYYLLNKEHLIYPELASIFRKYSSIAEKLTMAFENQNIETAFIFGSYAESEDHSGSDIDLMVIGSISAKELSGILRSIDSEREINYALISTAEFRQKLKRRDPFYVKILKGRKIYVKGNIEEIRKDIR